MDILKQVFPFSFKVKEKDVVGLVVSIVIYLLIGLVAGLALGLLSNIPVVNILVGIVGWAVEAYNLVGIVLAVLNFFNVLK